MSLIKQVYVQLIYSQCRQDSDCDIIFCLFAREDAKVNDSLMQVRFNGMIFCFYLVCYLYAKTDFGVHMRHDDYV